MVRSGGIWRFSGPLRILALVLMILMIFLHASSWLFALFGDTELVFVLYLEREISPPLELWQLLLGMLSSGVMIFAYVCICLAANQFLKTSKTGGFFVEEVIGACRKLGFGLIFYWIALVLTQLYTPGILTFNLPESERVPIVWSPLNFYVVLLAGIILLLIAQAMKEARELEADNKMFI